MGIEFNGSLSDYSLSKILVNLNRKRATGTLSVSTPAFTKKIYLIKGDAVFASSSYADDRLGEMLLKAGKISVEQYDRSVEILKATKKRQGAILVELGYLAPKDLFWGVKYQVMEIIYGLFQLEEGECEFIEGDVPADEVITLKMSMGNLIYEGVKKIDNWTKIRREMPNTGAVLKLSQDPISLFQGVELTPQDKKMLPLIDGKKTIKEIVDSSWMNSFEAMKTIYVLWSIGILEEETQRHEEAKEAKEAVETISLEDVLQPFAEEEDEFVMRAHEIYSNLDKLGLHELLEIDENSDTETVKKNYYRLAREFHPDRYFSASDDTLKEKLTAIFDAITAAYAALKDESKRKKYFSAPAKPEERADRYDWKVEEKEEAGKGKEEGHDWREALDRLATSAQADVTERVDEYKVEEQAEEKVEEQNPPKAEDVAAEEPPKEKIVEDKAEEQFKKGKEELEKGNYSESVGLLNEAVKINPERAHYWGSLSSALSNLPKKLKEAEKALQEAIKLEPLNGDYYTDLGFLYLRAGLGKRASGQFEKALKFDSGNTRAKEGLAQAKGNKGRA